MCVGQWTGRAGGVLAQPVVQPQRVQVRRRAHLQHQVARAGGVRRARRDHEELPHGRRMGLDVVLHRHRGAVCDGVLHLAPHGLGVRLVGESQQHPGAVLARRDVVRLVLGVRPAEDLPHVLLAGVEVQRQVSAAHGVEVVEPDGEGRAEPAVHLLAEHLLGMLDAQQLERDLDLRPALLADQDARLGRDQLVAEGRVARLRGEAELARRPLTAPRGGVEVRTGAHRAPGQTGQRGAQRGTVQRGRPGGVLDVDPPLDAAGERVTVPVLYRPVGVEQADQTAGCGGPSQIDADRQFTLGHGRLGVPLRQVRVPQHVRRAQRGARPVHHRHPVPGGASGPRNGVEQVRDPGRGQGSEERVAVGDGAGGDPLAGVRRVVRTDVEERHLAAGGAHGFREAVGQRGPVERRGTLHRQDERAGRQRRGRDGPADGHLPGGGRIAGQGVVRTGHGHSLLLARLHGVS